MRRAGWLQLLKQTIAVLESWEGRWPPAEADEPDTRAEDALRALMARLTDNFPFGHPSYAGQMLKPPHPVAWVAYAATMLINPNNHALDGGPATARMELEVIRGLGTALGFWETAGLGHLTSSGTMANLEALWVARQIHPGRKIAFGSNAHYSHGRCCDLLGVQSVEVAADGFGRMDLLRLQEALDQHDVGTLVVTLGTTSLGALDPLSDIIAMTQRRGVRVHVDAAYGGFFALLAGLKPPLVASEPFEALLRADSMVVDPHKHGLQPYGCGAVLFRDASVGRLYGHESPYTYFTSDDLHLGQISLECSRAGAAAAALWATMRAIPFEPDRGLGPMLAAGRQAALEWHAAMAQSEVLKPLLRPETDILCFAPLPGVQTTSELSARSEALFEAAMRNPKKAVYLAKLRLRRSQAESHWPGLKWDTDDLVVLRSVLMKPEHHAWWPRFMNLLEVLAKDLWGATPQ
ncbi:MAG: pyridoxal phosphate-dependent decarboxylase family protein [Myxococcota bacterium]